MKNHRELELHLPRMADRDPVERNQSGNGFLDSCKYCTSKQRSGQYKYSEDEELYEHSTLHWWLAEASS
ncbi:MAG: hypothetical protein ABSF99_13150, partial [Anaerolineales bacterium]